MYQIFYHKLVEKEDFKKIPVVDRKKIAKAVNKKLSVDPESFGKPLVGELKGYFRLRVDFYRVIYKIEKEKVMVFVVKVGLRKDLVSYVQAAQRLGLKK